MPGEPGAVPGAVLGAEEPEGRGPEREPPRVEGEPEPPGREPPGREPREPGLTEREPPRAEGLSPWTREPPRGPEPPRRGRRLVGVEGQGRIGGWMRGPSLAMDCCLYPGMG